MIEASQRMIMMMDSRGGAGREGEKKNRGVDRQDSSAMPFPRRPGMLLITKVKRGIDYKKLLQVSNSSLSFL